MDKIFLQIINMSITSSYIIIVIIVCRMFLKKAPKIFSYLLWMPAFLRFIFPFSFESIFSLITINTKAIPEDIIYTQTPKINSGIMAIDGVINNALQSPGVQVSTNPMEIWVRLGSIIWILGLIVLVIYSIFMTTRLSTRLKSANHIYKNIYETNKIKTPFVFGIISPKIYLPKGLIEMEKSYIIKHEETHIKRFDHIVKFLCFLITSIHWFNPLAWIAFTLMSEDMELSCDETVIKEMGYHIKKDYSNSLLSLSTGKRIIAGSPLAFGENNTKGRIKNILNYKKPKFWVSLIGFIVIVLLALGFLSNQKQTTNENKTVEDYAWEFVDSYEKDFKIVDKEIIKLEKISTFDNILSTPIELWYLDFKLKPEDINNIVLAGGGNIENDWITDLVAMGNPMLTFTYEKDELIYLGNANAIEFQLDTLASQETAIRIMLENKNILPKETYKGNHVVVKFTLSTGETSQLLLSQPIIQGDKGIWIVERWMDGNGTVYHASPETNIRIEDYYKELQNKYKEGKDISLGEPLKVAYDYIINVLGQRLVNIDDLVAIFNARIDDFLIKPESHYIGYITNINLEETIFHLDIVELLVSSKDEERINELGIVLETEYYIYNSNDYVSSFIVSEDTEYLLVNLEDLSNYKSVDKETFIQHNQLLSYKPLYNIYTKGGYVTKIQQQYLP